MIMKQQLSLTVVLLLETEFKIMIDTEILFYIDRIKTG